MNRSDMIATTHFLDLCTKKRWWSNDIIASHQLPGEIERPRELRKKNSGKAIGWIDHNFRSNQEAGHHSKIEVVAEEAEEEGLEVEGAFLLLLRRPTRLEEAYCCSS